MRDLGIETIGGALHAQVSDGIALGPGVVLQGTRMRFQRNEEIFGEGEKAEYVYRVVSGAVRTIRFSADGRRQIMAFHLPGDVFGLEEELRGSLACARIIPECGVNATGQKGGDADAVRGGFLGQSLRESPHAPLRGAIDCFTWDAAQAGGGDDVDDVAVLLRDHGLQRGLRAEDGAFEVHIEHEVDLGLGVIGNPAMTGEAGVVHPDGDGAELRGDLVHGGLYLGGAGDIAADGDGVGIVGGDGIEIEQRHARSTSEQRLRGGKADAFRGSGDGADLVHQVHGSSFLVPVCSGCVMA